MKLTKLDIYLRLSQHRRIGSTLFNVMGVNYDRKGLFLFSDFSDASRAFHDAVQYLENQGVKFPSGLLDFAHLRIGQVRFAGIGILSENKYAELMGVPISIDHFALARLIEDDREARFKEWTK